MMMQVVDRILTELDIDGHMLARPLPGVELSSSVEWLAPLRINL